jgi:hypothetical protein
VRLDSPAERGAPPRSGPATPELRATATTQELALRQLQSRVDALLKGHRAQLAAYEAERSAHRSARLETARRSGRGGGLPPLTNVDGSEIEADLAE